jgi:hypothetical protein
MHERWPHCCPIITACPHAFYDTESAEVNFEAAVKDLSKQRHGRCALLLPVSFVHGAHSASGGSIVKQLYSNIKPFGSSGRIMCRSPRTFLMLAAPGLYMLRFAEAVHWRNFISVKDHALNVERVHALIS